ncbi:MAG TPA: methyltransferase [Candidatus Paceibacterota bacterium]
MNNSHPTPPRALHITLARSYMAYFLFSMLGLLADSIVGFSVVIPFGSIIAITCFISGAMLMMWAQKTSNHFRAKTPDAAPRYFHHGPYRYLRNPTHLGMVIMVTGYAAISGSVIFLGVTVLGYIVSNVFFKRYEAIVVEQYGEEYTNYKSDVPKIL